MKSICPVPAPRWLRGALVLSLFALSFVGGCSSDDVMLTDSIEGPGPISEMAGSIYAPDFCPSLPAHGVVVIHNQPGPGTLFNTWFWGIGPGYDVADGYWPGWCIEDNYMPNVKDPGRVTLWCSYDPELPGNLSSLRINELNYLLNHRYGTYQEIQAAIWMLTWGSSDSMTPTANSYAMYNDAIANGASFVPGPGELIAVFCYTGDGGIGPEGFQETLIELRLPGTPPPPEGGACTPGYWKTHFDRWPLPYAPGQGFDATFGTSYFGPSYTLAKGVWAQGGGLKRLARHGVAALLNAAHGDVEYRYTVDEVIALVRSGDADALAGANEEFECPLGGTSADPQTAQNY